MIAACPFPAPRGTPIRIFRMAEALAERGHEVHVVTYHLGSTPQKELPFHIHRIPRVSSYTRMEPGPSYQKLALIDLLLAVKVLRVSRQVRPDVIHAHHYEGLLVGLPAHLACGIPLVFDSHVLLQGELEFYDNIGGSASVKRRVGGILDRHLSRRADHVVAVTEDITNALVGAGILPPERVTTVGNGVELAFFDASRSAFPADGQRRIIFTGNLARYQGTDLLLSAFAQLLHSHSDVRLVVVTNSDRADFEKLACETGVLDHVDFVDTDVGQLPNLIASADVATNPRTLCPGVPQKLLNYMAAGGAIVSFAGSAKTVRNGETAIVVPDGDIDAFARAMQRLLEDNTLRNKLSGAAQDYARRNFSWQKNAAAIESIYGKLITHPTQGNAAA